MKQNNSKILSQYLDIAPIVIYECLLDKDWTMLYINPMIKNLSGYDHHEFIHNSVRTFSSIIHVDDQSHVEKVIFGAIEKKSSYELKYRIITKSGEVKWVLEKGIINPHTGNLVGYLVDYTQEYLVTQKINEQNKILDAFFEHGLELLLIVNLQGKILSTSKAFNSMLGFTHDEIRSKNILSLIHPDDQEDTKNEITKLSRGEDTINYENRYICKDGSVKYLKWHASSDGAGVIYAGAQDITDKIKSERHLSQMLNAIYLAAIVVQTDSKGIIIDCNENFLKISGYEKHELVGKDHRIINSGVHPKSFFQEMWSTIKSGKVWLGEITNRNKSGTLYVVQTVISPLVNQQMEIEGYFAIRFDVTKEKNALSQLESEKLKSLQNAKLASLGELSASVAHEINNPMAIIMGTLSVMPKTQVALEDIKKLTDRMYKAGERVVRIVQGLQKYSRSADSVEVKQIDLSSVISESILLTDIKAKKLQIKIENLLNGKFMILANELHIEQVIVNLINNEIDAVKELDEKWIKISISENANHYILSISDSGKGVSKEVEAKMFEPFFTTKKVGEGTGLGLSIVKGILDEHQAKISLNTTAENTTFEIQFLKVKEDNVA